HRFLSRSRNDEDLPGLSADVKAAVPVPGQAFTALKSLGDVRRLSIGQPHALQLAGAGVENQQVRPAVEQDAGGRMQPGPALGVALPLSRTRIAPSPLFPGSPRTLTYTLPLAPTATEAGFFSSRATFS